MKTLILCVDRDNDVGVKADINGPLIGREANLEAAMKLGLADPEDADVNTLLTGISMHDELVKNGMEAEVATICGDANVGYRSDSILMKQLDQVLEEVRPDMAYLVSDGAEDEFIFPMVASRVKINHVKRVYVKQSPKVESFLYMLTKAAKEPRWRRRLFVPIALALVVFGAMALYDPQRVGPILGIVLGLYLLYRTYEESLRPTNIYKNARSYYTGLRSNILEGKVSVFFSIGAGIIAIVGILNAAQALRWQDRIIDNLFRFLGIAPWYFIGALMVTEVGKVVEAYVTKGRVPRSVWVVMVGLLAIGFIFLAALDSFAFILGARERVLNLILGEVLVAIGIIAAAVFVYRSVGRETPIEDAWRP